MVFCIYKRYLSLQLPVDWFLTKQTTSGFFKQYWADLEQLILNSVLVPCCVILGGTDLSQACNGNNHTQITTYHKQTKHTVPIITPTRTPPAVPPIMSARFGSSERSEKENNFTMPCEICCFAAEIICKFVNLKSFPAKKRKSITIAFAHRFWWGEFAIGSTHHHRSTNHVVSSVAFIHHLVPTFVWSRGWMFDSISNITWVLTERIRIYKKQKFIWLLRHVSSSYLNAMRWLPAKQISNA